MDSDNGLGKFIKARRKELGITQLELAKRLGMNNAYLSQVETGIRRWPRKWIEPIANELGVAQYDLAKAAGMVGDDESVSLRDFKDVFERSDPMGRLAVMISSLEFGKRLIASRGGEIEGLDLSTEYIDDMLEWFHSVADYEVNDEGDEDGNAGAPTKVTVTVRGISDKFAEILSELPPIIDTSPD